MTQICYRSLWEEEMKEKIDHSCSHFHNRKLPYKLDPYSLQCDKCGAFITKETDNIIPIISLPLPFNTSDKIFSVTDENGNIIGDKYSYDDFIQEIKDISGVNPELLGSFE